MWHVPMMCNFLDCWTQLKTASLKTSLSIFRDFLVKTQFYTLIMCNHCSFLSPSYVCDVCRPDISVQNTIFTHWRQNIEEYFLPVWRTRNARIMSQDVSWDAIEHILPPICPLTSALILDVSFMPQSSSRGTWCLSANHSSVHTLNSRCYFWLKRKRRVKTKGAVFNAI